jgi:hypothetical protein
MSNVCSAFVFFYLAYNTSNCVPRVLKISILKFSKILLTSSRVTTPLVILLFLVRGVRILDLVRELPLEHLMHYRTMSS